jgi:DNA-binding transcriptional LysR family regulator
MRPEVRHLVYFLAAAEELNFTRAARRLHVVPQALSTAIAQLEDILGVKLFDRTPRRVALTGSGTTFLRLAREAVAAVDAATLAARDAGRGLTGRLRVGLAATGALALTPRLLRAFARRYPQVVLEVRHFDFTDPSGGMWSDESDVALVRPPFDVDGLVLEPIGAEPRYAVLPADHPLSGTGPLTFAQLAAEPWMDVPTDPQWCHFWSGAEYRSGPVPRSAVCLSQDDLFEAARAHRAIGLVPASVARAQAWPGLAFVEVSDIAPSVVSVALPGNGCVPQAANLASMAREVAGRQQPALDVPPSEAASVGSDTALA